MCVRKKKDKNGRQAETCAIPRWISNVLLKSTVGLKNCKNNMGFAAAIIRNPKRLQEVTDWTTTFVHLFYQNLVGMAISSDRWYFFKLLDTDTTKVQWFLDQLFVTVLAKYPFAQNLPNPWCAIIPTFFGFLFDFITLHWLVEVTYFCFYVLVSGILLDFLNIMRFHDCFAFLIVVVIFIIRLMICTSGPPYKCFLNLPLKNGLCFVFFTSTHPKPNSI